MSFGHTVFLNPECAGRSLVDLGYIAKLLVDRLPRLTILFELGVLNLLGCAKALQIIHHFGGPLAGFREDLGQWTWDVVRNFTSGFILNLRLLRWWHMRLAGWRCDIIQLPNGCQKAAGLCRSPAGRKIIRLNCVCLRRTHSPYLEACILKLAPDPGLEVIEGALLDI